MKASQMFKPTILIDFDKTISPVHGFYLPPSEKVVDSIRKLQTKYEISIYSTRCNPELTEVEGVDQMIEYLKKYDIPFDTLCCQKPVFAALIDDRSFNPNHISWDSIVEELLSRIT